MLNITIPVVPSRPNQITPFTSGASQHGPAFGLAARLMLILPRALRTGGALALIYAVLLEFLYERVACMKKKKKDGFLKRGFLTDKGLFAIGIKEGPAMNHGDVRECSWKVTRVERYARLKR